MKKFFKTAMGVTLLEVMLVLAIAAMIIVMSVRYYQSTNAANQANTTLSQITSIVSAADSLAQASGSYITGNIAATVPTVLPVNGMQTAWGTTMAIASVKASSYQIQIPGMPANVCPLVASKLTANAHFSGASACGAAAAAFNVTYTANP